MANGPPRHAVASCEPSEALISVYAIWYLDPMVRIRIRFIPVVDCMVFRWYSCCTGGVYLGINIEFVTCYGLHIITINSHQLQCQLGGVDPIKLNVLRGTICIVKIKD